MGKNNRHSAVRKLDPQTLEVVSEIPAELSSLIGSGAEVVVTESDGTAAVETNKVEGVNKIAVDGHTMETLMKEHKNFSGVIRFLASKNYKIGDIAKFMNKRYQHVRNVLHTPAKKTPAAPAETK